MTKIFNRLSEYHGAFFIPPSELIRAGEWCKKHDLMGHHCTTLSNIHARWLREPHKPLALRDISRLYCISRNTARKLLDVLACECGYSVERSRNSYGLDDGFLLVPIRQAPGDDGRLDSALINTAHFPDLVFGDQGKVTRMAESGSSQSRGWISVEQGTASSGATSRTLSRTMKEGFKEEVLQKPEWLVMLEQYQIGTEQEAMLEQSLKLWAMRQGIRQGCSSVDACDVQEIVEAVLRTQEHPQEGEEGLPLAWLLAEALSDAECEFWQQGKNVPECAGGFFSKRINLDCQELKMRRNQNDSLLKLSNKNPQLAWDKCEGRWVSCNPRYDGPMPKRSLVKETEKAADASGSKILSLEQLRASVGSNIFSAP